MKAIQIACLLFALFTLIVTIAFFSWWGMKDRLVFGDDRFDQVGWITAVPTADQPCHRGGMAYDIQQRWLDKGMPRQAATVLLGRPTWEDDLQIEYDLGYCLWDTHGLRLYFDDQDGLLQSRIVQH